MQCVSLAVKFLLMSHAFDASKTEIGKPFYFKNVFNQQLLACILAYILWWLNQNLSVTSKSPPKYSQCQQDLRNRLCLI